MTCRVVWPMQCIPTPKPTGCTVMTKCTKLPYATPGEALRALAILRRRGYLDLAGIHPCAMCHAWHTTSKKQRDPRRRPRGASAGGNRLK